MKYDFEWDPRKAKANARNHRISFDRATTIFRDPQLLSIPDEDHSESEDRWITMGLDENGILLVVVHTFKRARTRSATIRLISARKATKRETKTYEEGI
jgi:uncharacterized DUF497 family protein